MNEARQKELRETSRRIWPTIRDRVGLSRSVSCPPVSFPARVWRISKGGANGVRLSRNAGESVLVHELLHCAMLTAGAVKRMKNGKLRWHSSRMRFLERELCKQFGYPLDPWAAGEPYSPQQKERRETLKQYRVQGCASCGGELAKVHAIGRMGTCFECKACKTKWWV